MKQYLSRLALLASVGTLLCCFLPAVFVVLGLGAAFASLISAVPALAVLSEHKAWVFGISASLIAAAFVLGRSAQTRACSGKLAAVCETTKRSGDKILSAAVVLFLVGACFAFVLPGLLK